MMGIEKMSSAPFSPKIYIYIYVAIEAHDKKIYREKKERHISISGFIYEISNAEKQRTHGEQL